MNRRNLLFWLIPFFCSCSSGTEVLILTDPYGPILFSEMKSSAVEQGQKLGYTVLWVNIPPQADLETILTLVPDGFQGSGILLSDFYEDEIFTILKEKSIPVGTYGYGLPGSKAELGLFWDDTQALSQIITDITFQNDLVKSQKPLIFAAVLGPGSENDLKEAQIKNLWPESMGADRLWVYRLASDEDRNGAIQGGNNLLSQNLDLVYLSAGKSNAEMFRVLVGGGVNIAVKDWRVSGGSSLRVRYSLERKWPSFWKRAFEALTQKEKGAIGVPYSLESYFLEENSPLKPFHIR